MSGHPVLLGIAGAAFAAVVGRLPRSGRRTPAGHVGHWSALGTPRGSPGAFFSAASLSAKRGGDTPYGEGTEPYGGPGGLIPGAGGSRSR
ncbi:hypothetical protein [Streptomyces sp. NPDC058623]|uniref:hypothetical protein n=1 Tax=Streptomyces sp. NPDC058623 TaxID=3346563 RepID=UPI003663C605